MYSCLFSWSRATIPPWMRVMVYVFFPIKMQRLPYVIILLMSICWSSFYLFGYQLNKFKPYMKLVLLRAHHQEDKALNSRSKGLKFNSCRWSGVELRTKQTSHHTLFRPIQTERVPESIGGRLHRSLPYLRKGQDLPCHGCLYSRHIPLPLSLSFPSIL